MIRCSRKVFHGWCFESRVTLRCSSLSPSYVCISLAVSNTAPSTHTLAFLFFFWLMENADTAAIEHLSHLLTSAAVCGDLLSLLPWLPCQTSGHFCLYKTLQIHQQRLFQRCLRLTRASMRLCQIQNWKALIFLIQQC